MARLKREGLLGGVRVWETTDGPKTGWHLHAHVLVISETAENCEEAAQHLKSRWVDLLAKRGWKSNLRVQDSRPVSDGFQKLGSYGAEDLKGWGVAAEMAGEWLKTGKKPDRLSVPELLALAHVGDDWAARRYAEAVGALAGQRMFVLGPKLKKSLGLDQVQDLTEETETPDLVPDDWRLVGEMRGNEWGEIPPERRPAAARLIYRRALLAGEEWALVLRRLRRLWVREAKAAMKQRERDADAAADAASASAWSAMIEAGAGRDRAADAARRAACAALKRGLGKPRHAVLYLASEGGQI